MPSPRDGNGVPTLRGALNTNGKTIVNVTATSNALSTSDGLSGSNFGTTNAQRDADFRAVWLGVSASDGTTPVEIYADASGNLLVRSS